MEWIHTPESSSIAEFAYSYHEMHLYVRFKNGRTYRYAGVPTAVYDAFVAADSKGTFFNARIQGRYSYTQL